MLAEFVITCTKYSEYKWHATEQRNEQKLDQNFVSMIKLNMQQKETVKCILVMND